jgi:glyoxylase-like metal-dependent hydrolase (beta-lactamase superfamily II)
MVVKKTGPINIVFGKKNARFPYVNSVVIESNKLTVIDPHSDREIMLELASKNSVANVFHSHFHSDHIRYTEFFVSANIHVHSMDAPVYKSVEALGRFTGIKELFGEDGLRTEERLFRIKIPPQVEFNDGDEFDCGGIIMRVIHTPGHSPGHSCFYFPSEKFLYLADIDLTDFGPWYGNPSSNLDDFIRSIEKIASIDADYYLSAHEAGLMDKETFTERFKKFTEHFKKRDELILDFISEPRTMEEIVAKRFIYKKVFSGVQDKWIAYAERKMIEQHIARLMNAGVIREINGKFLRK